MKYLVTALIILASAGMPLFANCSEADRQALTRFDKDWTDANAKGEAKLIESFYADEFTAFPRMTGKQNAIDTAVLLPNKIEPIRNPPREDGSKFEMKLRSRIGSSNATFAG